MNSKFTLILRVSLIFIAFSQIGAGERKKNLKLVLDKIEKVKDTENIISTKLTLDRKGDTNEVVVNGILETSTDLDNIYTIDFYVLHSAEKNGEKDTMFRVTNKGVCAIFKTYYKKFVYESLKKHSNAPDPDMCPVPKGKLVITNYNLEPLSPVLPGFYTIVAVLRNNSVEVMRYGIKAHTEEL